jgi:hypothetical protein
VIQRIASKQLREQAARQNKITSAASGIGADAVASIALVFGAVKFLIERGYNSLMDRSERA